MSFKIFLLFGQIFLDFSKVDHFSSLSPPLAERSLDFLFELNKFFLMAINWFSLHSLGLYLILMHLVVPIFIELWDFLKMCHLNLPFFLFESSQQLFFSLLFELFLHFCKSSFGGFCLHVFSCLFAIFLMSIEHFPAYNLFYIYSSRVPPSKSGKVTRLILFYFPFCIISKNNDKYLF